MKKAFMIICVLVLLALLAVPVLAEVLAGPDCLIGPTPRPGTRKTAGVENPVQIARGGFRLPVEPPFYAPQSMAWAG